MNNTRKVLLQAAAWAIVSGAAFAASSAAAKLAGVKLPPAEVSLFRAAAAAIVVAVVFRLEAIDWRQARDPGWHAVRIVSGVLALIAFMFAVTALPIAVAQLLLMTRVLLMPIVARILLGEPLSGRLAAAAVVGMVGAGVTVWPALTIGGQLLGVLAALGAAISTALSQTAVRRLSASNSPALIVCIYGIGAAILLAPVTAVTGWVTPPASSWSALVALGIAAALAQYAAVAAFKLGPVAYIAPLDFTGIPIAAAVGYLLFGDVPSRFDLVGAVLIIGSAWYVIRTGAPEGNATMSRGA
jgi:drug/metabolite transporter (DMT)-like permease